MIITIDGPAGAGKSTVARQLARRLGFQYLDTGAMYRAVALVGFQRGVDWGRPEQLVAVAESLQIELDDDRTIVDGEDVSRAIRTAEVTAITHYAADNPDIRAVLVRRQQEMAGRKNVVTEGRDQGTVVFPDATCKFFVTASPEERARRRLIDLERQGEKTTLQAVLGAQTQRDRRDASREVGPLVKADDAVEVVTDGMSIEQVVERLVELIQRQTGVLP